MNTDKKQYKLLKKKIIGYEGLYEAHSNGLIWSILSSKYIGSVNKNGYKLSVLVKNGVKTSFPAHRVIALYFIKNPLNKPYVNHINGIKDDNRPVNLEWCTAKENSNHSFNTGLSVIPKGTKNPMYGRVGYSSNKGKEVLMINKETNKVVRSFGSALQASVNIGKSRAAITANCRGESMVRGNFIFKYSN